MATTYSQALLDQAQAYTGRALTSRRYDQGLTELGQLYAAITGEAVGKCRQCQYSDFMAVVTAYIREATRFLHPHLMADSKYTFAPGYAGEVIADGRYKKTVTAENLTDEDATALLKLGYGHVIVLKPGQEAAAAAADGSQPDFIVERTEKSQVELDLEAEERAHDATQKLLTAKTQAYNELQTKYQQQVADHGQLQSKFTAEAQGRATAEQQVKDLQGKLTDVQGQLATAQQKLSRKNTPAATAAPTAAAPLAPTAAPVVSTSDGASDSASTPPTAPAPPLEAPAGTAGN